MVYPAHWEADGLLRDGRPVHLRPMTPADGQALRRFHDSLSEETIYFRFFAPYPTLSDRDVKRFTEVDQVDRAAIVATIADDIIGIGRYDRIGSEDAEVAFVIHDDHQGRGLGSMLLEHLAAAARENGVKRFVADCLPTNRRMANTFTEAGFAVAQTMEDGVIHLTFDIEPTARSRTVMEAREHRNEAASVRRLLTPTSIAVVGASREPGTVGHAIVRNLVDGGFRGDVFAVHPEADEIYGVTVHRSLRDIDVPINIAIVAVNAASVHEVVADAADSGVLGLIIVSSGFADAGAEGLEQQRELVRLARGAGMRIVGPNALGIINTDPGISMNASLASPMPTRGRVGFFCQSGALASSILHRVGRRQLGLSTFVSAGNRADVSGNDLLQFWEEDPATAVVLLYLESIGNPRKFARLARRLARRKPVVAVRTSGSTRLNPTGHAVRHSDLSREAIDSLMANAGIIQTETLEGMLQVASLLAYQPLPKGRRLAVFSNSDALSVLTVNASDRADLEVTTPAVLSRDVSIDEFTSVLNATVRDPGVDSILILYVPPIESERDEAIKSAIREASMSSTKPIAAVMVGSDEQPLIAHVGSDGMPIHGSVPLFADVEFAIEAIAQVTRYAEWLNTPQDAPIEYPDHDLDAIQGLADTLIERTGADRDIVLSRGAAGALLGHAGIGVWPQISVTSVDEAVDAAGELGYPCVIKTTDERYVGRPELGGIRLNLDDADAVRVAFDSITAQLDDTARGQLVVQRMAPPGVACRIRCAEDPLLGPVVSFGLSGSVNQLLNDRSYRLAPLSRSDVEGMVHDIKTSPMLLGYRGAERVDVDSLYDLLGRIGHVVDAISDIIEITLNPVIVGVDGLAVVEASITLRRTLPVLDARRLAD